MTDGPTDVPNGAAAGGSAEEPLTPQQEEQVSRLLAAASGPTSMPADVAGRLDAVLADLQEERRQADVIGLHSRRRMPRLLLAAAAVVVGGYAVGTVATQGTLGASEDSAGAGEAADSSASTDSLLADEPTELDGGSTADGGADAETAPGLSSERGLMRVTVRLRSDRLEVGVLRALRVLDARPVAELSSGYPKDTSCEAPGLGKGERLLDVRYDGEDAVLVTGPERSGTVTATVYSCSGDELDSTLVRP